MRRIAAILLISVIIAAPVSRYADYVHCLTLAALHLQANCGCDNRLYALQDESDNNAQQTIMSHGIQGFSDWFFYEGIHNALVSDIPLLKHILLSADQYPPGFPSALLKPPGVYRLS